MVYEYVFRRVQPLSWIPCFPWFSTGTCLFEELEQQEDALWVREHLWGVLEAAVGSKMLSACCGVLGAVPEDMLNRLDGYPALACDFGCGVLGVEALGVHSGESVACCQESLTLDS
jgi:hypothetical protein